MIDITRMRTASLIGSVLVLAGCAGNPDRPDEQLAMAESAIQQAEQGGAAEYSPLELDAARKKLMKAQDLAEEDENAEATRLAEQAHVDAQLATAASQTKRAERAAAEIREGIGTLESEAQRESPAERMMQRPGSEILDPRQPQDMEPRTMGPAEME
jgi:hypothetical protein